MIKKLWPLALLLAGSAFTPAQANEIRVPTDQPNLSAAIAAAQPGDLIRVQTTAYQNDFGGVTIDKPLTIRGEPACRLSLNAPGLLLAGGGAGRVTLENVEIDYEINDANGKGALSGSGFDEVVLIGCDIRHDNVAATGVITLVYPAIDLPSVAKLSLIDCDLLGGPAGADDCVFSVSFYENGREGILAPNADVVLLSSSVEGGRGGYFEYSSGPCPASLSDWPGKGGVGIVAKSVFRVESDVNGGLGASWGSFTSGQCGIGPVTTCGAQGSAADFQVSGAVQDGTAGLSSDVSEVSLSAGGVQELSLVCAPALGNSLYLVLGSFSGSSPGLPLGPFVLPLATPDPYFTYSFKRANGPVLGSSLGLLDLTGRATTTVTIAPGLPSSFVGITATHAFALADLSLNVLAVSNPVTLELLP